MLRSLYSGVSGIRSYQLSMDVIADNIANVNTPGFKAARTTFRSIFSQLLQPARAPMGNLGGVNPRQVGLGVSIASIDTLFNQGAPQSTRRSTDLAINGNGFFILTDGQRDFYTRSGNFSVDSAGNLVYVNGMKVKGWLAVNGVIDRNRLQELRIPVGATIPPKATSQVALAGLVDARTTATLSIPTYTLTAGDGTSRSIRFDVNPTGNFNEWAVQATWVDTGQPIGALSGTWQADRSGILLAPSTAASAVLAVGNSFFQVVGPAANASLVTDPVFRVTNSKSLQFNDLVIDIHSRGTLNVGTNTGTLTVHANQPGTELDGVRIVFGGDSNTSPPTVTYDPVTRTVTVAADWDGNPGPAPTLNDLQNAINNALSTAGFTSTVTLGVSGTYTASEFNNVGAVLLQSSKATVAINVAAKSYDPASGTYAWDWQATVKETGETRTGTLTTNTADQVMGSAPPSVTFSVNGVNISVNAPSTGTLAFQAVADPNLTYTAQGGGGGTLTPAPAVTDLKASFSAAPKAYRSLELFDSLGNLRSVLLALERLDNTQWEWRLTDTSGATVYGTGTLLFSNTGALQGGLVGTATIPGVGGAANMQVQIDFARLLQAAGDSSVTVLSQDGYAQGQLTEIAIDDTGVIKGSFSNGVLQDLGQVTLATFANQEALVRLEDTLFEVSPNVGAINVGAPGTGNWGSLTPGFLEMSNVDLSQEFSALIAAQRALQANSRMVTASDEVLQEIVNLMR